MSSPRNCHPVMRLKLRFTSKSLIKCFRYIFFGYWAFMLLFSLSWISPIFNARGQVGRRFTLIKRGLFCACCTCRSLGGNLWLDKLRNGCTPFLFSSMKKVAFYFLLAVLLNSISSCKESEDNVNNTNSSPYYEVVNNLSILKEDGLSFIKDSIKSDSSDVFRAL